MACAGRRWRMGARASGCRAAAPGEAGVEAALEAGADGEGDEGRGLGVAWVGSVGVVCAGALVVAGAGATGACRLTCAGAGGAGLGLLAWRGVAWRGAVR